MDGPCKPSRQRLAATLVPSRLPPLLQGMTWTGTGLSLVAKGRLARLAIAIPLK